MSSVNDNNLASECEQIKCMMINTGRERILICLKNVNQTAFLRGSLSACHPLLESQILPKWGYTLGNLT